MYQQGRLLGRLHVLQGETFTVKASTIIIIMTSKTKNLQHFINQRPKQKYNIYVAGGGLALFWDRPLEYLDTSTIQYSSKVLGFQT